MVFAPSFEFDIRAVNDIVIRVILRCVFGWRGVFKEADFTALIPVTFAPVASRDFSISIVYRRPLVKLPSPIGTNAVSSLL